MTKARVIVQIYHSFILYHLVPPYFMCCNIFTMVLVEQWYMCWSFDPESVSWRLQVNDVQLYGKSRREVISFLKEVPPPFTLVCCRLPTSDLESGLDLESEPEPEPDPAPRYELKYESEARLRDGPSLDEVRTLCFYWKWSCRRKYRKNSFFIVNEWNKISLSKVL